MNGRTPLRWRWSTLDCGAIEEGEEEEEFKVVNISSYRAVDIELPLIGFQPRFVKSPGNPTGINII